MSELNKNTPNSAPALIYSAAREKIDQVFASIAAYDPSDSASPIPQIERHVDVTSLVLGVDLVPDDILLSYASIVKFTEDAFAVFSDTKPNYWKKLEEIGTMMPDNMRTLYNAKDYENPLRAMLTHQLTDGEIGPGLLDSSFDILKTVFEADNIPAAVLHNPDDPTLRALATVLQSGERTVFDLYRSDTHDKLQRGSQELRSWMREAIMIATAINDPNQADAYTYSSSRNIFGVYGLDTIVDRIKTYGPAKLKAIYEFANITALSSYSDEQLDRIYKLSQGDSAEIEYLNKHDVIVCLINMDGDHNGVSAGVAERLDDEAERTLFFEITNPHQVYRHLKKLYDIGISPTTLIFASHGSAGQFYIGERPPLDSDKPTSHITVVIDQDLADFIVEKEGDNRLKGYNISTANGLIRSVQRFMQPSRAIDDPDKDLGRKKIISLSCEFDGDSRRASLGPDGETVNGERTTLLRRLGEVLVSKLKDEHLDIYGAVISTNQQTKTDKGFHYNQMRDGRWAPYPASVLHIDGQDTEWHRLNEVQLRKTTKNSVI